MAPSKQLSLPLTSGWGGRRARAGRKRANPDARPSVPHRSRGPHRSGEPVHVTLRAQRGMPSLRAELGLRVLQAAIERSQRAAFRITHFSIQRDHVHLLIEASDGAALASGMRGLVIRMARRLNAALRRRGSIWADRWHGRALSSPREVRNALAYVLLNARKHQGIPCGLDPCASVVWSADAFADRVYRDGLRLLAAERAPPVALPRTWLLSAGWRRHGLLGVRDFPKPRASRAA
jgi:REP element-mobilizing transposase RayT